MPAPARGTLALGVTLAGGNASVAVSAGVRGTLGASLAAAGNVSASRVRVVGVAEVGSGWGATFAPRAATRRRLSAGADAEYDAPALPEPLASGGLGVWRYLLTVDTGAQGGGAGGAVSASEIRRAINASLAVREAGGWGGGGVPNDAWAGVLAAWAHATGQSLASVAAGLVVDGLAQSPPPSVDVEPPAQQQQLVGPAVAPLSSDAVAGVAVGAVVLGAALLAMVAMWVRRRGAGGAVGSGGAKLSLQQPTGELSGDAVAM